MENLILYDNENGVISEIKKDSYVDCAIFLNLKNATQKTTIESMENVFIICESRLNFVSSDFLNFIQFCKDNKIERSFKVIVFEDKMQTAEVILLWFKKLRDNFGLNFDIISELELFENDDIKRAISILKKYTEAGRVEAEVAGGEQNRNTKTNTDNKKVVIYTDGACSGNPGAGGWGAVLMHGEKSKEISGFDPITTNNKMELTAVIMALTALKQRCEVDLYSDSAYVVNAITQGWLENWKNSGWIGSDKKPVKNIELWQELDKLITFHSVQFYKVKGHADNVYNNRCDELAVNEITKNANL